MLGNSITFTFPSLKHLDEGRGFLKEHPVKIWVEKKNRIKTCLSLFLLTGRVY